MTMNDDNKVLIEVDALIPTGHTTLLWPADVPIPDGYVLKAVPTGRDVCRFELVKKVFQ
jgi:hypothetical protein